MLSIGLFESAAHDVRFKCDLLPSGIEPATHNLYVKPYAVPLDIVVSSGTFSLLQLKRYLEMPWPTFECKI